MPKLHFEGKTYERRDGETVLDALMRQGRTPPYSCREGVCLVCLMRRDGGEIPAAASEGLQSRLRDKGYFLACRAVPKGHAQISLPRDGDVFGRATVVDKTMLGPDIGRLRIEPATSLYYHAGQFVNLRRPADGLTRSYSLASVPTLDDHLELHVRRIPFGRMSSWLLDELDVGDEVDLQGPEGRCFYRGEEPTRPLWLLGTGTGLAPLYGILRDALHAGHQGEIRLFVGAKSHEDHYLVEAITQLVEAHENLNYRRCSPDAPDEASRTWVHEVAFSGDVDLSDALVYLCGAPAMIEGARVAAIGAGAEVDAIYADPFVTADIDPEVTEEPVRYPPADPEMWQAFDCGPKLRAVLEDFYRQVYDDPRLRVYFGHTHIQRSIGKQYEFLARVFTGTTTYFGDRPRNAHHWMVISDELFDHRAALMQRTLRAHGLPEKFVRRFAAMEEGYRRFIVKSRAWPRIMRGITYPLEGYETLTMTVGTLCDACQGAIEVGEEAQVHVRLGTTFCATCYRPPPTTTVPPPMETT